MGNVLTQHRLDLLKQSRFPNEVTVFMQVCCVKNRQKPLHLHTVTFVCLLVWLLICSRSEISLSSDTYRPKMQQCYKQVKPNRLAQNMECATYLPFQIFHQFVQLSAEHPPPLLLYQAWPKLCGRLPILQSTNVLKFSFLQFWHLTSRLMIIFNPSIISMSNIHTQ